MTRWHGISRLKLLRMMAPTARAAFRLHAFVATSLYVMVFPLGIWRTTSRTLSANVLLICQAYYSATFSSCVRGVSFLLFRGTRSNHNQARQREAHRSRVLS